MSVPSQQTLFQRLLHFLAQYSVPLVAVVTILSVSGMLLGAKQAQNNILESIAVEQAENYSRAISSFRNVYTSEVTSRIQEDVIVTHNYDKFDSAIPLPATMSHLLGEKLTENTDGGQASLYSNYPFPWQLDRHTLDTFQQEAIDNLNQNPAGSFYRIETINGNPTIRYATANVMQEGCVGCHNTHSDSPKTDWAVGDVRGVLEVQLPLTAGFVESRAAFNRAVATFGILGILATLLAAYIIRLGNIENERILKRAKEEAENATAAREVFIAKVSHELRTPLSAILASAKLLQMANFDKDKRNQKLQMIEKGGDHILELLNDILDLSKIEANKMNLELSDVNIRFLCHDSLMIVSPIAKEKDIQLILQLDPQIQNFQADERRLRQILINLLSNATKFTPSEGRVGIRTTFDKQTNLLNFTVWDTGIGMSHEDTQKLFNAYTQLDKSLEKAKGTGLGLVLVKQFAELHGGRVEVSSRLGVGTQFNVSIPVNTESSISETQKSNSISSI